MITPPPPRPHTQDLFLILERVSTLFLATFINFTDSVWLLGLYMYW